MWKAVSRVFMLALFLSSFNSSSNAQKTWIGAGAGGAGTDFNTGSNWSPAGVPTATDDVIIAITAGTSTTISLSANASIRNLTYTITGNNRTAGVYVGGNTLTVNGTTSMSIVSGNNNTLHELGVNGGTSAGVIDFVGNVTISTGATGAGSGLAGNANSKLIFRGNVTFGTDAYFNITNRPGTLEFDGTGSQNITWDNTGFFCEPNNVVIGNLNNPTINQITGAAAPDNILGNLTVNGASVLNLGTSRWNGGTAGGGTGNAGTFTLNSTSLLRLANNTGGQTGSNFPLRFSSLNIGAGSTVEYSGSIAQTIYDIPSPGYGNLTVTNNSTKSPTSGLDIRGNLLINATATFSAGTGLSHNLAGNFTNNNVFTAGTSTMVFNGNNLQTIGGTANTTFNNLTANNTTGNTTTGISLARPCIVTNILTLTSGHLTTTATNILTMNAGSSVAGSNFATRVSGGSDNSFVNGPMRKIGNTDFLFPVGKISAGHRYCGLSGLSAGNEYQAEFIRASASALGSINSPGPPVLNHVSNCEYWNIDRVTGTSANVTLSWNGSSNCNAAAYVTDLASLVVAHFGTQWDAHGRNATTGTASDGSVTWNGVSTFSPFALGSTNAGTNPLPVKLVNARAFNAGTFNKIEWTNLTESSVRFYEVEKSINGINFETFTVLQAKANDETKQDYTALDNQVLPTTYYRIKVTERTGQIVYSAIMRVETGTGSNVDLLVYPNPVKGRQATVQLKAPAGQYNVHLIGLNGQQIPLQSLIHPGGTLSATVELPTNIISGQYIFKIFSKDLMKTVKILVE